MTEQGNEPGSEHPAPTTPPRAEVPSASRAGTAVPPAVPYSAATPSVNAQTHRRSRAWIWWTLGILAVLGAIMGSCVFSVIALSGEDAGSAWGGFGDSVGVIYIDGIIAGTGDYYSGYVTPEYFYDLLDQAAQDDSVKAVVLRIDSPGGTVAASEEIARYAAEFEKPLIVSVGDVGASGAYMLASQCDEIWALPGSAVGSIGVIAEIPNVSGLLDKLGVEFQVITAGKYKDAGSPYRPLTDDERALIQGEVDEAYDQFIDIVAEGRDLERSKVETLATGLTWSGERAKDLGLVDEIGTMQDALDAAADAGGIEGDYDIVYYQQDDLSGLLGSFIGFSESLARLSRALEAGAQESGRVPIAR